MRPTSAVLLQLQAATWATPGASLSECSTATGWTFEAGHKGIGHVGGHATPASCCAACQQSQAGCWGWTLNEPPCGGGCGCWLHGAPTGGTPAAPIKCHGPCVA